MVAAAATGPTMSQTTIAFTIALGAILFYQVSHSSPHIITSLILMTLWAAAAGAYIWYQIKKEREIGSAAVAPLKKEYEAATAEGATGITATNYYIKKFDKTLKFLVASPELVGIADAILYCRISDKWRYRDLLLAMDKLQKVYMYILADRYLARSYIPIFIDLRDNVLELMYSFYVVIPKQYKHVYGVDPHTTLADSITRFQGHSRKMLRILENYSRRHEKDHWVVETDPRPADAPFAPSRAHRLP